MVKEGITLRLGTRAWRVIADESIHKRKKEDLGAAPSTAVRKRERMGGATGVYDDAKEGWDRTRRTKVACQLE